MSNKRIPNLSVTDGFDFVKKIWGNLPIPSVMNPTTDLDELDKRISDLKAVEQWLNVNLSMLRATIQGLEVQRGTIATIKSFSSNLGLGGERSSETNQAVNAEIIRNAMQAAVAPLAPMVPPSMPRMEPVVPKIPDPEPAVKSTLDSAASNATAWWSLLQDQFNKVVATAALTAAGSGTGTESPDESSLESKKPKAKRTATPRTKSPSSSRPPRTRT